MARSAMAGIVIALAVGFAVTVLLALELADTVELPARDLALRSLPQRTSASTVVVAIDEASLRALGPWPWPRERLARIVDLARAGGARAVVFDVLLSDARPDDELLAASMRRTRSAAVSVLVENDEWLVPARVIADSTVVAHGNFELDHDGIVRRFASTKQSGARAYAALALVASGFVQEVAIPIGRTIAPAFRTHPDAVPRISAAALLAGGVPAVQLGSRIVFVGPTALGLGDRVLTPVSRRYAPDPGVTVHAATAESLLRRETVEPAAPLSAGAIAFLLVLALLGVTRFARRVRLTVAVMLTLVTVVASHLAVAHGRALPAVTLLATIFLTTATIEVTRLTSSLRAGRLATSRLASGLGIAEPASDEVAPSLEVIATRLAEERARAVESKRVLAHELKTPLASMRSLTQLMAEFELSEAERRRVTSLLQSEAGKLQDMVQGLLDLERLPLRDFASNSHVVDLGELVRRRADFLRAGTSRTLTVTTENDAMVRADDMLIERVLDNLVGNAMKYARPATPVSVSVAKRAGAAVIEVADEGPGIPEAERNRIFERFARGSTAHGTEGLGLGLALVAEVARWHGGDVHCDSNDSGSRFVVSLPMVE